MATTFQVNENEQNDFQKTLADTLLSKLNIDSKFLNEVIERVVNLASKNVRVGPIKQTQQPASRPPAQTKEKETPKSTPVQNENKTQTSNKQTVNKNESLNTNKNVFQIVDPSKQKINLPEKDTSKQDSLFNKFTSVLENTTSKLEQTVKKVPRPWELTPGTAMGYQMLTGKESMGERARKGFTQFMGRYATNIKEPFSYIADNNNTSISLQQMLRQVLTDKPYWNKKGSSFMQNMEPAVGSSKEMFAAAEQQNKNVTRARDTLYREMFDLPARAQSEMLKKIGDKQYTLTSKAPAPWKVKSSDKSQAKTAQDDILGGTYLTPTDKTGLYKYKDIWDIVSPSDSKPQTTSSSKKIEETRSLRQLLAPLLRPATVSGRYDSLNEKFIPLDNKTKLQNKQEQKTPINFSDTLSKQVSTKLEKMPILSSLTKGIESIKGNKMVEGLKEISSVAPSVKPIVSFLTANETSIKPKSSIELTDSKSFSNLKDWMKETTVSKLNNWSTDLYDWSKQKISGFTKSMDSVFTGNEKLKPINADSLKVAQTPFSNRSQETKNPLEGFDVESLNSLVKRVQPDTPSLQDKIGKENVTLNNGALDQIVGNTKATNEAMKTLGNAILRLAQTFNASGRGTPSNNLYAASGSQNSTIASNQRVDIMGGIASASQLAATNNDTIRNIRNQFMPRWT